MQDVAWINSARVTAIFAVIIIHLSANIVTEANSESINWWVANFFDSLSRWAVPVFVMISGALLLSNHKQENPSVFYKNRLSRILWPLLFWSIFYTVWIFVKDWAQGEQIRLDGQAIFLKFLIGEPYFHLWFIFMITGLYAITPLLRILIQYVDRQFLLWFTAFAFVLALSQVGFDYHQNQLGNTLFIVEFLYYVPYFLLGHIIAESSKQIPTLLTSIAFIIASLSIALGLAKFVSDGNLKAGLYFYEYLSLPVAICSVSIFMIFKQHGNSLFPKICKNISPFVLGIYLVHIVFIEIINAIGLKLFMFDNVFINIAEMLIMTIIVFALSFISCFILSKIPFFKRVIGF
jgi:surface polysaccharide O-acyltransferase-like enzyme